ncbi:hypothetical protein [Arthrobacter sp. C9C5]|uniref:hypothetical protein n=1 Tax=Arthrobacter sp. C9C5 TaxID=2735267 RepID=UPI001C30B983|nr:hypothetical protein [Arthrobacter sp. C9C5]
MRISPAQPISTAQPVRPQRAARVARVLRQAAHRIYEGRVPFRIGQLVVGDDPFNGRREGTVEVIRAPFVGLRVPGTPAGTLFFFDHRNVRQPE